MVIFIFPADSDLLKLISGRGWQVAGETVHIRKQEDLIKPKKILAKIDMESELKRKEGWGEKKGWREEEEEGGKRKRRRREREC